MARATKRTKMGLASSDMPPAGPFPYSKGSMNEQHVDLEKGGIHILIREYGVVNRTACQHCIGGHRVKGCKHWFRVLRNAKRAGRPLTHCDHVTDCGEACTEDASFVCLDPPEYYELACGTSVRIARYMGQQPKQLKSVDRVSKSSASKSQKDKSTPSTKPSSRSTSDSLSPKIITSSNHRDLTIATPQLPSSNMPLSHCANGVCQCDSNCSCLGCEVHGNVLPANDPANSCGCQDTKPAELCLPIGNVSSSGCASDSCQCGPKCSCLGCKTHGNVSASDDPANPCACQTCQCYSEVVIHATAGPEHDRRQLVPRQESGCCSSKNQSLPATRHDSLPYGHRNIHNHYPHPHASAYAHSMIPTSGPNQHHSQQSASSHQYEIDSNHFLNVDFSHYDSIDPDLIPGGLTPSQDQDIPFPFTSAYLPQVSTEAPHFLDTEGLDIQSEYGLTSPYDIVEQDLSLFDAQFGLYTGPMLMDDPTLPQLPDPVAVLRDEDLPPIPHVRTAESADQIVKRELIDEQLPMHHTK